jgi:2-hydroxy-3-keto-5-methylthiopentenyl-1-phosphate phosphatase
MDYLPQAGIIVCILGLLSAHYKLRKILDQMVSFSESFLKTLESLEKENKNHFDQIIKLKEENTELENKVKELSAPTKEDDMHLLSELSRGRCILEISKKDNSEFFIRSPRG